MNQQKYFEQLLGVGLIALLLVGCGASAAAPTQVRPMATPTLVQPTAAPTASPTTSTVPLVGVMGIEVSGGFLWAWNGDEIWRYTGGEWSPFAASPYYDDPFLFDVAYLSDRLWAAVDNRLQYLEGDQWQEIPGKYQDVSRVETDDQTGVLWVSAGETVYRWNGEQMTDAGYKTGPRGFVGEMAVTGDGGVWASSCEDVDSPNHLGELIHYDDVKGAWEIVRPWRPEEDSAPVLLAPAPNGDLWVVLMVDFQYGEEYPWERPWVLDHRDGVSGEWTAFEEDLPEGLPLLMAADDEAVWLAQWAIHGSFDSLTSFDGETWSHFLPGNLVKDVDVAPDGSIWYTILDDDDEVRLHQLR
jgi:hypothetical protein